MTKTMPIERIDPKKTAMIVVDMQKDFIAEGAPRETPAARAMIPILLEAMNVCRAAGIRIIYTAHVRRIGEADSLNPRMAARDALVDGTPGVEICPELG